MSVCPGNNHHCRRPGSGDQLHRTELANGIVQDEPEVLMLFTDKLDLLLLKIRTASARAAAAYGACLARLIGDFIPPSEILTKCVKELLTVGHAFPRVIARIVCHVFRATIDAALLALLQDWLICSVQSFAALPTLRRAVWSLSVVFVAATLDVQLLRLFELVVAAPLDEEGAGALASASDEPVPHESTAVDDGQLALLRVASEDFWLRLNREQRSRFQAALRGTRLDFVGEWLRA